MVRTATLLLLLASCSGSSDTGSAATTREIVDLFPQASITTVDRQPYRIRLMAEAKTHRLSLVPTGRTLSFGDLEIPGRVRFEASVQVLGAPRKSRAALFAVVVARDETGSSTEVRHPVRTAAADGDWTKLSVGIEHGRPLQELSVTFEREDFGVEAQVAVLRPVARFELPRRPRTSPAPGRVLLVTTDTLRADALGCYGNTEVRTPYLDALAADGVLFEQCYSAANVTNPSHTSIFTSLWPKDHKVLDNFTVLGRDVPTMLEPLRAAGMRTAAFVSSFNFAPEKSDLDRRFDEFFPCQVYFERRAEDVNTDLLPWLGDHADEAFFVWAHYFDPHMPYAPPAPYDRMYPRKSVGEEIELPLGYKGNLNWFAASRDLGHYRALYRGEVSYLDHHLGELFARLKDLGIYDETTVVVVADHGEAFGEHGVYCEHATLFDEVTRVPLIVKPAGSRARRSVDALVSTVDLFPTIFELLDLALPDDLRGRSLAGLLRGEVVDFERDAVFSTFARGSQESLRTKGHRFLLGVHDEDLFPGFSLRYGKRELYRVDGGELVDRLEADPELARDLEGDLRAFLSDKRDWIARPVDPEAAAEMEKLGYTQGD